VNNIKNLIPLTFFIAVIGGLLVMLREISTKYVGLPEQSVEISLLICFLVFVVMATKFHMKKTKGGGTHD